MKDISNRKDRSSTCKPKATRKDDKLDKPTRKQITTDRPKPKFCDEKKGQDFGKQIEEKRMTNRNKPKSFKTRSISTFLVFKEET
jgi:hypothetical protein